MPELPEVEITARLLSAALKGAVVDSAHAPGINVMKTFDPPLSLLAGEEVLAVRRRGKHFVLDLSGGHSLLIHLMSAGRLQLYGERAGPRDRTSRLLVRLRQRGGGGEQELRLREFGSKQAAWAKLLPTSGLDAEEALASLGPEAWPYTPPLEGLLGIARPLHTLLRDQRVIAGIGRSWVDEILWEAMLSPYKRGSDLDQGELERLRDAISRTLGGAMEHYEHVLSLPIPDRLPMPLKVHARQGQPCPRCGSKLLSVHFEDYVISYCPHCQTGGRALKDRRLSRLLK